MGTYEGLGERELFLMEYRGVQHAKLAAPRRAAGDRVALVTGAAGAIGTGVATGLLEAGCHVVVTDLPARRWSRSPPSSTRRFPAAPSASRWT